MKIDVISNGTLKVTLTKDDMDSYNLTFDSLDRSNAETKELFVDIVQEIQIQTDIDVADEKLYIEAFPKIDGGCLLYISTIDVLADSDKSSTSILESIICEISSQEGLIELCSQLYKKHNHKLHNSELYFDQGKYRLIVHSLKKSDKSLNNILYEYGTILGRGEVLCSLTREHYESILPKKAIERIWELTKQ